MFYTNAFIEKNFVYVRGYDNEGKRFNERVPYEPYLFFDTKEETGFKNLQGGNVQKRSFESLSHVKNWIKQNDEIENSVYYGYTDFVYPFIYDYFGPECKYDLSKISIGSIDIEVKSDEGFPEPQDAAFPITAITVGDKNRQVTLAYKPYKVTEKNHEYIQCKNELDLITKFVEVWRRFDFDIITGWNTERFDIPYIVNRIIRIAGKNLANRLSPWERVYEKFSFNRKFGQEDQNYIIKGISHLDYMHLYKTFSFNPRESYALNHIAYVELNENKLDYSEYDSLNELYEKNHTKFIDYNLQDNLLIFRLDEKLGFLGLALVIAYDSLINYEDALTSVKLWEVISHKHLMQKGIVLPKRNVTHNDRKILGGYVKEPVPGKYKWITSFDFASLYPHLIMQFNFSPETMTNNKIHQFNNPHACIDMILDGKFTKDLSAKLRDNNLASSPLGITFDQSKRGFLPELMETIYKDRSKWKKIMIEADKESVLIEQEIKNRGLPLPKVSV